MRQNFSEEERALLGRITFLAGSPAVLENMCTLPAREPFCPETVAFLDDLSKELRAASKSYPDVATFAFWIRRASTLKFKERYPARAGQYCLGRGTAFHISPSNVPVNFAYSLAAGMLTGNHNIVRIPTKPFPQAEIIVRGLLSACEKHKDFRNEICLVRYERDRGINDLLSSLADTRIIWGGDATVAEVRKSPLPPRANEITFADRFSLAVIDSEYYLAHADKHIQWAEGFYYDTYLTDQNACTSPRAVVWTGAHKKEAKELFWRKLRSVIEKKYTFKPIQFVDKYATFCRLSAAQTGLCLLPAEDNRIVRVRTERLSRELMDLKGNSGFFFEYDCDDITELKDLCDDSRCQTVSYIGESEMLLPLIASRVKGIDRIVPVGQTMDFDFLWDGYDLYHHLTRIVSVT